MTGRELTAIDLELQRIGWDRDQERIYLERAFGHGSRHRLTRFNDLVAYLKRLRDLPPGSDPQQTSVPLRRSDLLQQSDEILRRLEWHQEKAIEFLKQNFQATSRQQLSDEQYSHSICCSKSSWSPVLGNRVLSGLFHIGGNGRARLQYEILACPDTQETPSDVISDESE